MLLYFTSLTLSRNRYIAQENIFGICNGRIASSRRLKSGDSSSVENSTDNERPKIDRTAAENSKFHQVRALFVDNPAILTDISDAAPRRESDGAQ